MDNKDFVMKGSLSDIKRAKAEILTVLKSKKNHTDEELENFVNDRIRLVVRAVDDWHRRQVTVNRVSDVIQDE